MSAKYVRKDSFYQQAKEQGFRSRAAYKLLELDKKFKFLGRGSKILDLGSWPGGWLQVACQRVGPDGRVVGIDLKPIEALDYPHLRLFTADIAASDWRSGATDFSAGQFDVLLSDLSPKITGIREVDQAASVGLVELAVGVAQDLLRPAGNMVLKVFKGPQTEGFVKELRPRFNKLVREELRSTRRTSNEYYIVGRGFRPDISS